MQTLPTIIGLKPDGKIRTFCKRITRTQLITAAFIFLSLLSLSFLVIIILQAKNHGKNKNNDNIGEYCLNRGCLSAATQQLRFMDNAVSTNRCIDFYHYACAGWQQTHPIESSDTERTILSDIINQQDLDIERLLNSPVSRISIQSWEWKVKTYYTECLDDYARVPNSGKILLQLIQSPDAVNGWFLFDNSFKNSSQKFLLKNQTIYQQISYIHGELGATIGFDLHVRFDDTDPKIKRLEFSPAGLTMEIDDYLGNDTVSERRRSIYELYIIEVLAILAREADIHDDNLNSRLNTIASDVFIIEKYLAECLQRSEDHDDKTILMTLQEMSDRYSFDFIQLLIHELGNSSNISPTTSVYVTNPTYFHELFSFFLNNTHDLVIARQIHNYMRWRLVRTYIEDLSYNYIHVHRLFLANYYNNALHITNEEYCTREVIRRFPLAIQRLYTMNLIVHSDTIQSIFDALKDGLKEYVNEQATWMTDETTKRIARQKIDGITAAIGYASIASDDARLDKYYEKFICDDKTHIENAYNYHRFYRWTISNSLVNPNQLDHWDYFELHTTEFFDYIPIFKRLFIIASAMHEPLVNAEWPWPINLGSLGVLLAQKLFTSIDGSYGIPDWWSSSTKNAYNTSHHCIANYYKNELKTLSYNVNNQQVSVQLTGEPFSLVTLRHIGALRFAYTTLKKMKPIKIPGTELTNEQTFFLAYAQTQCYQRQDIVQFVLTKAGVYDERTALNTALIHMPEFAKAFQCHLKENTCF